MPSLWLDNRDNNAVAAVGTRRQAQRQCTQLRKTFLYLHKARIPGILVVMFSSECRADIYMFAFQILAVVRTSEGGAGAGEVTQLVRLQLQQGLSIG